MKQRAAVVGAAQSRFGDYPTMSIKELFLEAYLAALAELPSGFDPQQFQVMYLGTLGCGGFQLGQAGPTLAGYAGLPQLPCIRVENACASGGFAFAQAVAAVESGSCDLAIAAGVEKMTDLSKSERKLWLGVSGDTEYERLAGMTFAGIYAMMAQRYLHDYNVDRKYLSCVAVKNHLYGSYNDKAQFRSAVDLETALKGMMVAAPLNIFDCSSIADGGAVSFIAGEKLARELTGKPVWVRGVGMGCDYVALHDRESLTGLRASRDAAARAFATAHLAPADIEIAEVHDCFSIAEIMAYEDIGFAPKGLGWKLLADHETYREGRIPVNLSGGLKAKGHPLGATGVAQVAEIVHQLRGDIADERRRAHQPSIGLTHNVGGSGGSAVVSILGLEA